MRSGRGDGQLRPPGFPIRTSSDHSLVADSPRLIAGSNVLHRLLVPRHPPCALKNLATYFADALQDSTHVLPIFKKKMLASTVQFSRYGRCRPVNSASALSPCRPNPRLRWCLTTPRPFPQDPTACSARLVSLRPPFHPLPRQGTY